MISYSSFANFYDSLTANIDYSNRVSYFCDIIEKHANSDDKKLLDLACGTGSLSIQLAKKGYSVTGIDISSEMLMMAQAKGSTGVQYVCQDMTKYSLPSAVDITICALDSINHLPSKEDILATFKRVAMNTKQGGLFIFDMNTPHKHKNILANNTFVYDMEDVYCVWQCSYDNANSDNKVDINLDFFNKTRRDTYTRYEDSLSEIAFDTAQIEDMLDKAGIDVLLKYDYDTTNPIREDSEKIVWVCKIR